MIFMLVILLEIATRLLFPIATALVSLILPPPPIMVSCCSIDTVVNNGLDIIQVPLNFNYHQSILFSLIDYMFMIIFVMANLRQLYY